MNKYTLVFLSLLTATQVSCGSENGPLVTINAQISNESGEPVEGAKVTGGFRGVAHVGELVSVFTDEQGFAAVSGNTPFSVRLTAKMDHFYESDIRRIQVSNPSEETELEPRSRSAALTLRAVKNPIALIARQMEYEIPMKDTWIGFDLEISDWVKPYGKGEIDDMSVRYSNEFLGYQTDEEGLEKVKQRRARTNQPWTETMAKYSYGDWSGTVEIKFSGEDEGIALVTKSNGYIAESQLRMPHEAPTEAYESEIAWNNVRFGQFMPRNADGYFLRVRVVKRDDEIIKANYAKINEEVDFDPRGKITFSYCYNPIVNDRNLEFDPDKNLLQLDRAAERVRLP
jgi:hypothetical protein